MATLSVLTIQ